MGKTRKIKDSVVNHSRELWELLFDDVLYQLALGCHVTEIMFPRNPQVPIIFVTSPLSRLRPNPRNETICQLSIASRI